MPGVEGRICATPAASGCMFSTGQTAPEMKSAGAEMMTVRGAVQAFERTVVTMASPKATTAAA